MRARGYTLAECMLAILFISIALFAYVSLQIRLIYSTSKMEQHQMWCEQANQTLIGAMPAASAGGSGSQNEANNQAAVSWSPAVSGPPGLTLVEATSTWSDHNGQHKFTMDTYVRPLYSGWAPVASPSPSPSP
ncbi:MAG: hypothetical protein ACYCW6_15110 [Candidatus Xenobia bacterium]